MCPGPIGDGTLRSDTLSLSVSPLTHASTSGCGRVVEAVQCVPVSGVDVSFEAVTSLLHHTSEVRGVNTVQTGIGLGT